MGSIYLLRKISVEELKNWLGDKKLKFVRCEEKVSPNSDSLVTCDKMKYCSISFKSTLGVTRDPKNHFDISTTTKIWCDNSEIFDIGRKIWAFRALQPILSTV